MRKVIFMLIVIIQSIVFAGQGDNYEPKLLTTEINAPVMLYLPNIKVGFTSVKVNAPQDYLIKSTDGKIFKLLSLNSVNIIEAIDANEKVLAYTGSNYELLNNGIAEINRLLINGEIMLSKLLDGINSSYIKQSNFGTSQKPDPKTFKKLRRVNVYNLLVEDSTGHQNKLQVFIETYKDASEL